VNEDTAEDELHQSESWALIAHVVARDSLPDKALQPFTMLLAQVHKSDGELTAWYPYDKSWFQHKLRQPVWKGNGEGEQRPSCDPLGTDNLATGQGDIFGEAVTLMRLSVDFTDIPYRACECDSLGISAIDRSIW